MSAHVPPPRGPFPPPHGAVPVPGGPSGPPPESPRRPRRTVLLALVAAGALLVIAALVGTAVVVSRLVSSETETETGEPITASLSPRPDRPDHAWEVTPASLGLPEGTGFEVTGHDGWFGVHHVGDVVVTAYDEKYLLPSDPGGAGWEPDPDYRPGLIAFDAETGDVAWKRELRPTGGCVTGDGVGIAYCEAPHDVDRLPTRDRYRSFVAVDLATGDVVGEVELPGRPTTMSLWKDRLITVAYDGGYERVSSGSILAPEEDWSILVDRDDDTYRYPCMGVQFTDPYIRGGVLVLQEAETDRLISLHDGTPLPGSLMPATIVGLGGTVAANATCPPGSTAGVPPTWEILRIDGTPLSELDGDPFYWATGNRVELATVPADDLPVFTTEAVYSSDGTRLWDWGPDAPLSSGATASVIGDVVVLSGVVLPGGKTTRGYDLDTGEVLWSGTRPERMSTPVGSFGIATDGERLFTEGGSAVSARTGEVEWELEPFPMPPSRPGAPPGMYEERPVMTYSDSLITYSLSDRINAYR